MMRLVCVFTLIDGTMHVCAHLCMLLLIINSYQLVGFENGVANFGEPEGGHGGNVVINGLLAL